jgi:penicillin-insensitive murein endopeptidase
VAPDPHPLASLKPDTLTQLLMANPAEAGSLSIGKPNRGALANGVQPATDPRWQVLHPERSWGTEETIASLCSAIKHVASEHPGTPPLMLGDISRRRGGPLRPHRSHQSGRDADIGFYYQHGPDWYVRGTRDNLDVTRTWALLKALLGNGNVEYVFVDNSVILLLKEQIATHDDPAWIDELFGTTQSEKTAPIRHTRGHTTHIHVRFYSERARETARLTYKLMARLGKL